MDPTKPDEYRAMDDAERESDRRIRDAKSHLSARLHELEDRIEGFKENIDPRQWVPNPWARAGAAFAIGWLLGRTHIMRPIIGAAFSAAATAVLRELVSRQLASDEK
jgi:hypothetical protein